MSCLTNSNWESESDFILFTSYGHIQKDLRTSSVNSKENWRVVTSGRDLNPLRDGIFRTTLCFWGTGCVFDLWEKGWKETSILFYMGPRWNWVLNHRVPSSVTRLRLGLRRHHRQDIIGINHKEYTTVDKLYVVDPSPRKYPDRTEVWSLNQRTHWRFEPNWR